MTSPVCEWQWCHLACNLNFFCSLTVAKLLLNQRWWSLKHQGLLYDRAFWRVEIGCDVRFHVFIQLLFFGLVFISLIIMFIINKKIHVRARLWVCVNCPLAKIKNTLYGRKEELLVQLYISIEFLWNLWSCTFLVCPKHAHKLIFCTTQCWWCVKCDFIYIIKSYFAICLRRCRWHAFNHSGFYFHAMLIMNLIMWGLTVPFVPCKQSCKPPQVCLGFYI